MAISASGTVVQDSGTGKATLSINPAAVGNAVLFSAVIGSASISAASLSGGNCSWTRIVAPISDSTMGVNVDLWLGVATATGAQNVTVTGTSSIAATGNQLTAQQYTAGLGATTVWAVDNGQASGIDFTGTATALALPSLTPTTAGVALYHGLVVPQFNGSGGTTTGGYVWQSDNFTDRLVYNLAAPSPAVGVGATQDNGGGRYVSVAALLTASLPVLAGPPTSRIVRQAVRRAAYI